MKGDECLMINFNNFSEAELDTPCTVQFRDLFALINHGHFFSDLSEVTTSFGNIQKGIMYDYGLIKTNPFGAMTLDESKEVLRQIPSRLSSFESRTDYKELATFVVKENETNIKYVNFSLYPPVELSKVIPITKTIMKYIDWTSLTDDDKVAIAASCIGFSLDDFHEIFPSGIPANVLSSMVTVNHYVFPYLYYDKMINLSDEERLEIWNNELHNMTNSNINRWIETFPAFFHALPAGTLFWFADVFKKVGGSFTSEECKILLEKSYKITIEEVLEYEDDELLGMYLKSAKEADIAFILKKYPEFIKEAPYTINVVKGLLSSGKTLEECFKLLVTNNTAYEALKKLIDDNTTNSGGDVVPDEDSTTTENNTGGGDVVYDGEE